MTDRIKITKGSGNVFRDLGFPEGEAQNLLLRSDLMIRIEKIVKDSGMTQQDRKSTRLNSSHPRLSRMPSSA